MGSRSTDKPRHDPVLRFRAISIAWGLLFCLGTFSGSALAQTDTTSFHFRNVELRDALDSLMRWYDVRLIYLDDDVFGKTVGATCEACRIDEALMRVLAGQGLVGKYTGGQIVLQREREAEVVRKATLAGIVRDSVTDEPVIAATVILRENRGQNVLPADDAVGYGRIHRWCSTNASGFYALPNIRPGEYVLEVRRLGYRTVTMQLRVEPGPSMLDVAMTEKGFTHEEVTVVGQRSAFSGAAGFSRGVYIRAAPSDYNQYFLEGARVYNPLHFGGIMSSFNADALHDIQEIAGGVPPYYGGRIGGILDVSLRDGNRQRLKGNATAGSVGSSALLEGPVTDGTLFVVSGRMGYPDVAVPRVTAIGGLSSQRSVELMGKVSGPVSGNQWLSLSAFLSRDTYDAHASGVRSRLSNSLSWENAAVNLRWRGIAFPALFFQTSGSFSRYGFDIFHRIDTTGGLPERVASDFVIEDAALRAHAEYFYDEYHTVLGGVELVRHAMEGRVDAFSSQMAPATFDGTALWEMSVYVQDQWRLVPSVLAEIGARATSFAGERGSFSAIDPRFSLLISLRDDLRIYSSVSSVTQFVHPYRSSGIFLFYPSIFFYPSTDKVPPSTSLLVSLGLERTFENDEYRVAFESSYWMTHKLHEFLASSTMVPSLSEALVLGEGEVAGVELTFEKRLGGLVGTLRYGYSWASNRFAELNGGAPFHPRFDRRHEIFMSISWVPSEMWTLSATALLSPPRLFVTGPAIPAESQTSATGEPLTDRVFATPRYAEPYDLNGGRQPGFQRIELSVERGFVPWGMPVSVTLSFLNGYGLVDPFVWSVRESVDPRRRWQVSVDSPPLFPLYPIVSVGMKF